MKTLYKKTYLGILFFLMTPVIFAQWQTNGPYGGPINNLTTSSGKIFAGTSNGVHISADNGATWNDANAGMERLYVSALTAQGTNLFAGTSTNGIYFSSDNGVSWTPRNTGITTVVITSLFTADSGVYAGTPDGIFATFDDGMTWMLRSSGIPFSYDIYDFTQAGDTIFAATYGLGLYQTSDNGLNWTSAATGIPTNTFVYALASSATKLYAGTSDGVYVSINGGASWTSSNIGFPPSMWAKSFTIEPGFVFAGTYSEGIFVSTDEGATWTAMNSGIPNLPFPTGLPHNYPSVDDLAIIGSSAIAATVDGVYRSTDNGFSWTESDQGIMGNDIPAIAVNSSSVFAGAARTGVYVSPDKGLTWLRKNNGLTAYDVIATTTKGSSAFVSVGNQKVFRSDDNGNTWISASTGLPTSPNYLEADTSRVIAITSGYIGIVEALYQTIDNGNNWTQIPTPFVPAEFMSTVYVLGSDIYVGTGNGKIHLTSNNGTSWNDISTGLPASGTIKRILISSGILFAAVDGAGVYRSTDNGASWSLSSTGISNTNLNDVIVQGTNLYVATWGGGVFVSGNLGASWSPYNTGLNDLFVRKLAAENTRLYAATDIGVYTSSLATGVISKTELPGIEIYPNPGTGFLHLRMSYEKQITLNVRNALGAIVFHSEGDSETISNIDLSGMAKGVYLLELQIGTALSDNKIILNKKIVIQK